MKDGILLIDKEAGMTSRSVDNRIQRMLSLSKAGHLGTLDPFATGLLIVAVGKGTKFLPYLDDGAKTYVATLSLGNKTSTGDPEGEVIEEKAIPPLCKEKLEEVRKSFLGKRMQLPPMTSAIKVDGVPLYKAAHQGKEIERKEREIEIFSLDFLEERPNEIVFAATVSKGTYIRVLGEDIAEALGTVGYLSALRRTAIGSISVEGAKKLDEIHEDDVRNPLDCIHEFPWMEVDEETAKRVYNGMKIELDCREDKVLLAKEKTALAVYSRVSGNLFRSERGLF